jgi:hypothetical protein
MPVNTDSATVEVWEKYKQITFTPKLPNTDSHDRFPKV